MREVQTLVWCDNTDTHDGQRVEATEETVVSVANRDPSQLDLCDSCYLQLQEMLGAWATMGTPVRGARVNRPRGKQRNLPTTCPECGAESISRGGLGQHLKDHHGTRFGDYENGLRQAGAARLPVQQEGATAPVAPDTSPVAPPQQQPPVAPPQQQAG